WSTTRTAIRTLALYALACRAAGAASGELPTHLVRALRRRGLEDDSWLALARELVRPFSAKTDAQPVPELVRLLAAPGDPFERLLQRKTTSEAGARGEERVRAQVADALIALAQ